MHAQKVHALLERNDQIRRGGHGRDIVWLVSKKHELSHAQELAAGTLPFSSQDYMLPTPDWAVYGAPEAGFDPLETRVKKARNHPSKAESGGCT